MTYCHKNICAGQQKRYTHQEIIDFMIIDWIKLFGKL